MANAASRKGRAPFDDWPLKRGDFISETTACGVNRISLRRKHGGEASLQNQFVFVLRYVPDCILGRARICSTIWVAEFALVEMAALLEWYSMIKFEVVTNKRVEVI